MSWTGCRAEQHSLWLVRVGSRWFASLWRVVVHFQALPFVVTKGAAQQELWGYFSLAAAGPSSAEEPHAVVAIGSGLIVTYQHVLKLILSCVASIMLGRCRSVSLFVTACYLATSFSGRLIVFDVPLLWRFGVGVKSRVCSSRKSKVLK
jgi:hypothetical protein